MYTVTDEACKVVGEGRALVEVATGACAGAGRIAAGSAGAGGRHGARAAFACDCEGRELWCQIRAMAFGALGFLRSVDQGFKTVMAVAAYVFKNRHNRLLDRDPAAEIAASI